MNTLCAHNHMQGGKVFYGFTSLMARVPTWIKCSPYRTDKLTIKL